jgi:hypothetical protein
LVRNECGGVDLIAKGVSPLTLADPVERILVPLLVYHPPKRRTGYLEPELRFDCLEEFLLSQSRTVEGGKHGGADRLPACVVLGAEET